MTSALVNWDQPASTLAKAVSPKGMTVGSQGTAARGFLAAAAPVGRAGPRRGDRRCASGRRDRLAGRLRIGWPMAAGSRGTRGRGRPPPAVWVLAALRRGRVGVDADCGVVAHRHAAGGPVPRRCVDRCDAGRWAGARGRRPSAARRHDLRALLEHAPRFARRRVGSAVSVIALDEVAVDDLLVVGPGEVVPVDGRICQCGGGAGRVGPDRRTAAGGARRRRTGAQRGGQRGQRIRNACHRHRHRQHIRADRATGRAGRSAERARGTAGRPVCGVVLAVDAIGSRRGVAGQRVAGAGGRRAGGGDSLPAVACRTRGDRVRPVARLASRCGDPQRRRAGKPRPRNNFGDGQDRHTDHGTPRRH